MEYTRECPICFCGIEYPNASSFNRAVKQNRSCKKCSYTKSANSQRKHTLFERNCPKCDKQLKYSGYHSWWSATKHNRVCVSCSKIGKKMPDGFSKKLSKLMSGRGNPMYGRNHTEKTKGLISVKNKGNKSKTGQIISDVSKLKMRQAVIKRIEKYGTKSRNFNPIACKFIEEYGKQNGYNFQHALNGGEFSVLGYFVDGYDKGKNVVFEYDEPIHNRPSTRKNDILRMNEIKNHLKCIFIRYNEKTKELKEF